MAIAPSMLIFYVDDVARSIEFYTPLLGRKPVEASSGFALFALDNGLKLAFWKRANVQPHVTATGGGMEIDIALDSREAVDKLEGDWRKQNIVIAQSAVQLEFGYTFVALDPDGHRLRVFFPAD